MLFLFLFSFILVHTAHTKPKRRSGKGNIIPAYTIIPGIFPPGILSNISEKAPIIVLLTIIIKTMSKNLFIFYSTVNYKNSISKKRSQFLYLLKNAGNALQS